MTKAFRLVFGAAAVMAAALGTVQAQPVTVTRSIPGYICMRLNVSREQMVSRDLNVPVYAEPSARSAVIGRASETMIVRSPANVENGFVQILFFNGREAWMLGSLLKPYAVPEAPGARCTPAVLSNGRIGFNDK